MPLGYCRDFYSYWFMGFTIGRRNTNNIWGWWWLVDDYTGLMSKMTRDFCDRYGLDK